MNRFLYGLGVCALLSACSTDLAGVIITENTINGTARMADSSASHHKIYLYQAQNPRAAIDSTTPNSKGEYSFKGHSSGEYFIASDSAGLVGNLSPAFAYDSTKGTLRNLELKPLVQVVLELNEMGDSAFSPLGSNVDGNKIKLSLSPDTTVQKLLLVKNSTSELVDLRIDQSGLQVAQNSQIKNILVGPSQILVDNRDASVYHTVAMGSQTWIVENIHYSVPLSNPQNFVQCPLGDLSLCNQSGYLYNWNGLLAASGATTTDQIDQNVCPSGFVLARLEDFQTLIRTLGGEERAAAFLKAKTGWNTPGWDLYGLNLKPADSSQSQMRFWTPTAKDLNTTDSGYAMVLDNQSVKMEILAIKDFAYARCIKKN